MSIVNIRREVQDAFYRYKMPLICVKIEGRGNGIKTVVTNVVEIGKALNRPPSHLIKFCGWEVGSLVICDEKAQKYVINGAHEAERLQGILDGFIDMFVLCKLCKNPETDISVDERVLYSSCKACGKRGRLDQKHKLSFFILKNPQTVKKSPDTSGMEGGMHMLSCDQNVGETVSLDEKVERTISYIRSKQILEDQDREAAVSKLGVNVPMFLTFLVQYGMSESILDDIQTYECVFKDLGPSKKHQRAILGGLERFLTFEHQRLVENTSDILEKFRNVGILSPKYITDWIKTESSKYVPQDDASKIKKYAETLLKKL